MVFLAVVLSLKFFSIVMSLGSARLEKRKLNFTPRTEHKQDFCKVSFFLTVEKPLRNKLSFFSVY